MMNVLYPQWHTGDILLDEALYRHYSDGFIISPYGLMIFKHMDFPYGSPDKNHYGHIGYQNDFYVGKNIPTLCNTSINLYGVQSITSFLHINQIHNNQKLCVDCCSKAEEMYWIGLQE